MATLQQQCQQTDSMNGEHEKDRYFDAGAAFVSLIET